MDAEQSQPATQPATQITTTKPAHTPIDQLMVTNFRTESVMDGNLRAWMSESDVAAAMSCARQVWFGDAKDFATFPPEAMQHPAMTVMTGQEAYAFLVRLKTGLESNNLGETNITGDFNAGWLAYTRQRPDKAEILQFMMNCITGDSRWIRKHVASHAQPTANELVARSLSGQQAHESALIIGNTGKDGIAKSTDYMMRAIGNNKVGTVSEIIITHPDYSKAMEIYRAAQDLRAKKILDASVSVTKFDLEMLSLAMSISDRTYIDLPMGLNAEADTTIITAWQERENCGNTLTHIRGQLQKATESSAQWREAGLDSYISPEDLYAERGRRIAINDNLIARGDLASLYCAAARMQKRQPSEKVIAAIAAGDAEKANPELNKFNLAI